MPSAKIFIVKNLQFQLKMSALNRTRAHRKPNRVRDNANGDGDGLKVRDGWQYQYGRIFGKIPNGRWPPLIFGKSYRMKNHIAQKIISHEKSSLRPRIYVQNLQCNGLK